jgi:hypothetical protein
MELCDLREGQNGVIFWFHVTTARIMFLWTGATRQVEVCWLIDWMAELYSGSVDGYNLLAKVAVSLKRVGDWIHENIHHYLYISNGLICNVLMSGHLCSNQILGRMEKCKMLVSLTGMTSRDTRI